MRSKEVAKTFVICWSLVFVVAGVAIAAVTLDNTVWVEYSGNPVYDPSLTRAYYPCVICDAGTYEMWYATESGISYATSADGISWTFVADCTGLQNPHHCWIVKSGSSAYEMWYWDKGQLFSIAAIRHADSSDGISWSNDSVVTQGLSQPLITGIWSDWNRGSYGPCSVLFDPTITTLEDRHHKQSVCDVLRWDNRRR